MGELIWTEDLQDALKQTEKWIIEKQLVRQENLFIKQSFWSIQSQFHHNSNFTQQKL